MTFRRRISGDPQALGDRSSGMQRLCRCAVALCLASATGCDGFADRSKAGAQSLPGDAAASAAPPERGFRCRTFSDETGYPRGYVVYVPHVYRPGDKLPVLMFLNGRGENGEGGISISNNLGLQIWEMQEFFPFLVVAPQCRTHGSWSAGGQDAVWALKVLDAVIEEFGANRDRVYLTGVSSGGHGVWSIGSANPERFAAMVPLCGGGANFQPLTDARMPIWNFYNDGDSRGLVESNRKIREQLIERGLSPLVSEYHAPGHGCWGRAYNTTALYGWLLEQSRSRNAAESLFDYLPSERLLAEWSRHGPGEWIVGEDGALVGQDRDGHEPGLLISPTATRSVEIHGDVWLQPNSICRMALLHGETPESGEGLWLSVMLPGLGTGGITQTRFDRESFTALEPAAQRALRSDAWNDLRVCFKEGRLTVRLNGWPAIDRTIESEGPEATYRCALATPQDASDIRWRYLRMRMP